MARRVRVARVEKESLSWQQLLGVFLLTILVVGFAFLYFTEPRSGSMAQFSLGTPLAPANELVISPSMEEAQLHCENPTLVVGPDNEERGGACPAEITP